MANLLTRALRERRGNFPWRTWLPHRRYHVAARVDAADLVPVRLPRKAMVVVEARGTPSWVAFDCPCRRRHRLLIRLAAGERLHWHLTQEQAPSLDPSVDSHEDGRRCHFWLTNGKVRWVRNRMETIT
jgi:Family of unknown function (DUF6527)